jgi:hypothetical protein
MAFDSSLAVLQDQVQKLEKLFLKHDVQRIAERLYDVTRMTVEQQKVLTIYGTRYTFDYALLLGDAGQRAWACSGGILVYEGDIAGPNLTFPAAADGFKFTLLPFYAWPNDLRYIVKGRLHPHAQALVQWDIVRWAIQTRPESIKGITVPESEALVSAFRSLNLSTEQGPAMSLANRSSTSLPPDSEPRSDDSHDFADHSIMFATFRSLQDEIGGKYMEYLPKREELSFFPQDDDDYHPISLYIGVCKDIKTGTVRVLYALLRRHTNLRVSPPVVIVMGQEITSLDVVHRKLSDGNEGILLDPTTLRKMGQERTARLFVPFRVLMASSCELFRAAAKFCFILAAESNTHGFKKHYIPQVRSFEDYLKAACECLENAEKEIWEPSDESQYIDMWLGDFQASTAFAGGWTGNTADAAWHATETGITDLDSLSLSDVHRIENLPTTPPRSKRPSKVSPLSTPKRKRAARQSHKKQAGSITEEESLPDIPDSASSDLSGQSLAEQDSRHDSSSDSDMPLMKRSKLTHFPRINKDDTFSTQSRERKSIAHAQLSASNPCRPTYQRADYSQRIPVSHARTICICA